MTDVYLAWSLEKSEAGFRGFFNRLQSEDSYLESGSTCGQWSINCGVVPCSPISPTVGITTEVLELYCVVHLWSPHLSIQSFVKSVCDLHRVEFCRHLSRQFSIVFDVYLQVQRSVAAMVAESLQRNSPDWRLKHACPMCRYELSDEEQLTFSTLYAMDGNNSVEMNPDGDESLRPSSELPTGQQLTSDRYLSHAFVDQFAWDSAHTTTAVDEVDDTKMKKAWAIYNETGVFVAVCCHGFSLLIADMVQSSELAKYPLAVMSKLMDMFGKKLGGGYDISCQFRITLDKSSLGPLACSLQHTCLVGAFHGHAHRSLCQLVSLTTYIKGLGLEDLETCERTFSKSNSLASSLCYASIFHRQQAIDSYFEHNDDLEVYANISDFLYNNYKQVLDLYLILMQDLKLSDESIFERWLDKGKVYLEGLTREPEDETLQMEYWQKLANLTASKGTAMTAFQVNYEVSSYDAQVQNTCKAESIHLQLVQVLECKLKVVKRWAPEDVEWQVVGRLVANRKYQCAPDRLEGLIIACIFELTRMNQAGTGDSMYPPHQTLKWEDVVEYAFLADFDLLRDTRADVSQCPWLSPAARSAMDLHFKICRARKEIQCLNIEIRCLATYIQDEDNYLRKCEDQLTDTNPALAYQIALHRNISIHGT
ncbi:hypothetical protein F4604DRAFT_1884456 [Suillus subluteus]|nr:hypothetical protein F4604DRAFT_1884456 [Suillus subluteus]